MLQALKSKCEKFVLNEILKWPFLIAKCKYENLYALILANTMGYTALLSSLSENL
jgi:hypothetical protein